MVTKQFFGRLAVPLWRLVVLIILGAAMVWLFSPSKRAHSLNIDRFEALKLPALPAAAEAATVFNEPEPAKNQPVAAVESSLSPPPSDSRLQKEPGKPTASSRGKTSISRSARPAATKGGSAKVRRSRTSFRKGIADFRVWLITLWRRSFKSSPRKSALF